MSNQVFWMADHSLLPGAFIFFNRTPTGVETPDVIDLRKTQRKEPEKPLYHVRLFFSTWM